MARQSYYQIRLSDTEKSEAFNVLQELGMTPAQAIRLFLKQVVETRSIPFSIARSSVQQLEQKAQLRQQLETTTGQKLKRFDTREEAVVALNQWFDANPSTEDPISLEEINAEIKIIDANLKKQANAACHH